MILQHKLDPFWCIEKLIPTSGVTPQQTAEFYFLCKVWTADGKEIDGGGWKDGISGVTVGKCLVKTVVCDYLDALRKVGKRSVNSVLPCAPVYIHPLVFISDA